MGNDDENLPLSAQAACDLLREAGLSLLPAQVHVEARETAGWCCCQPIVGMVCREFCEAGGAWKSSGVFCVYWPSLLAPNASLVEFKQGWDIRASVPGICDPWGLYRRTLRDIPLARRIGRTIGSILVEEDTRVTHNDVAGWRPTQPQWPEPSDRIKQQSPQVIDDGGLLSKIDSALDAYDGVAVGMQDRVLVHGNLGLHNIAVDPETTEVRGVFDMTVPCSADRHHDFRYLRPPAR